MSIKKREVPLLEFDSDKNAVLRPDHENLDLKLPKKAVFMFLGEYVDKFANEHNAKVVSEFVTITKRFPIYIIEHNGEEVCLVQAPLGASASAMLLDWLIVYGVREIISGGSCGALEEFEENTFIVPSKALRDEGTSYHYTGSSRFIDINPKALEVIEETVNEYGFEFIEVTTWTTDGFFRETKEKIRLRKEEGCSVVEMECSALAACANFRGAIWGEILFTADTLANIDDYDSRDWGVDSYDNVIRMCLDAVVKI